MDVCSFVCKASHSCPSKMKRKCAICDTNFKFIAKVPFKQECGDLVCEECIQFESLSFCCINHGPRKILGKSDSTSAAIMNSLDSLFDFLESEYKCILKHLNGNFCLKMK